MFSGGDFFEHFASVYGAVGGEPEGNDLEQKNLELKIKVDALQEQLAVRKEKMYQLLEKQISLEHAKKQAEDKNNELRKAARVEVESLQEQLRVRTEKQYQLLEELNAAEEAKVKAANQNTELMQQYSELKMEMERLQEELRVRKERQYQLLEKMQATEQAKKVAEDQSNKTQVEVAALHEQLRFRKEQLQGKQAEFEQAKAQAAEQVFRLEEQLRELQSRNAELQSVAAHDASSGAKSCSGYSSGDEYQFCDETDETSSYQPADEFVVVQSDDECVSDKVTETCVDHVALCPADPAVEPPVVANPAGLSWESESTFALARSLLASSSRLSDENEALREQVKTLQLELAQKKTSPISQAVMIEECIPKIATLGQALQTARETAAADAKDAAQRESILRHNEESRQSEVKCLSILLLKAKRALLAGEGLPTQPVMQQQDQTPESIAAATAPALATPVDATPSFASTTTQAAIDTADESATTPCMLAQLQSEGFTAAQICEMQAKNPVWDRIITARYRPYPPGHTLKPVQDRLEEARRQFVAQYQEGADYSHLASERCLSFMDELGVTGQARAHLLSYMAVTPGSVLDASEHPACLVSPGYCRAHQPISCQSEDTHRLLEEYSEDTDYSDRISQSTLDTIAAPGITGKRRALLLAAMLRHSAAKNADQK